MLRVKSKDVSLTGNMAASILILSLLPIPYLEIIFIYIYREHKYVVGKSLSIVLMIRMVLILMRLSTIDIIFVADACGIIAATIYFIYRGTASEGLCIVYQAFYNAILLIFIEMPLLHIPISLIIKYPTFVITQMIYTLITAIFIHRFIVKLTDPIVEKLQWMGL